MATKNRKDLCALCVFVVKKPAATIKIINDCLTGYK
jgi:hypothetical protein